MLGKSLNWEIGLVMSEARTRGGSISSLKKSRLSTCHGVNGRYLRSPKVLEVEKIEERVADTNNSRACLRFLETENVDQEMQCINFDDGSSRA